MGEEKIQIFEEKELDLQSLFLYQIIIYYTAQIALAVYNKDTLGIIGILKGLVPLAGLGSAQK